MLVLDRVNRYPISSLAFSPNGRWLAAASSGTVIGIWETTIAELTDRLESFDGVVNKELCFLRDDQILVAGATLQLCMPSRRQTLLSEHILIAPHFAISPDRNWVALVESFTPQTDRRGDVKRIHLPTSRLEPRWRESPTTGAVAYSPDGRVLATSHYTDPWSETPNIRHWLILREVESGAVIQKFECASLIQRLAFDHDGSKLVVLSGAVIQVHDVASGEILHTCRVGRKHFRAIAYAPGGRRLLSIGNDETVRVWETETYTEVSRYEWPIGRPTALAITHDGLRAAVGGQTGNIIVWDMDD